jgi:thymidylate synthase
MSAKMISMRTYDRIYNYVAAAGAPVMTGGVLTREVVNAAFVLRNVRDRVVIHQQRKMNLSFGIAEWVGLMTGYHGVDLFTPYIKDYAKYSSDGILIDGAYGDRLHRYGSYTETQLDRLIQLLADSPDTRRAVLSIYNGVEDLCSSSRNTPCTLTLQFLIRNGRLNAITTMRSNDVVRGFTYDVFQFTMLQEYVAAVLGIPPGAYYHNAGSLHIYQTDLDRWPSLEREPRWTAIMKPMPRIPQSDLQILLEIMREPQSSAVPSLMRRIQQPYVNMLARTALAFVYRRDDPAYARKWYGGIHDLTIRKVMRLWLDVKPRGAKRGQHRD